MLINKLKAFYIVLVGSTFGGGILFSVYNTNPSILEINPQATADTLRETQPSKTNFEVSYNAYVEKHNRIVAELLNSTSEHNSTSLPGVVVVKPDMKTG